MIALRANHASVALALAAWCTRAVGTYDPEMLLAELIARINHRKT